MVGWSSRCRLPDEMEVATTESLRRLEQVEADSAALEERFAGLQAQLQLITAADAGTASAESAANVTDAEFLRKLDETVAKRMAVQERIDLLRPRIAFLTSTNEYGVVEAAPHTTNAEVVQKLCEAEAKKDELHDRVGVLDNRVAALLTAKVGAPGMEALRKMQEEEAMAAVLKTRFDNMTKQIDLLIFTRGASADRAAAEMATPPNDGQPNKKVGVIRKPTSGEGLLDAGVPDESLVRTLSFDPSIPLTLAEIDELGVKGQEASRKSGVNRQQTSGEGVLDSGVPDQSVVRVVSFDPRVPTTMEEVGNNEGEGYGDSDDKALYIENSHCARVGCFQTASGTSKYCSQFCRLHDVGTEPDEVPTSQPTTPLPRNVSFQEPEQVSSESPLRQTSSLAETFRAARAARHERASRRQQDRASLISGSGVECSFSCSFPSSPSCESPARPVTIDAALSPGSPAPEHFQDTPDFTQVHSSNRTVAGRFNKTPPKAHRAMWHAQAFDPEHYGYVYAFNQARSAYRFPYGSVTSDQLYRRSSHDVLDGLAEDFLSRALSAREARHVQAARRQKELLALGGSRRCESQAQSSASQAKPFVHRADLRCQGELDMPGL